MSLEIPSVARIGVDPSYFARLNKLDTAGYVCLYDQYLKKMN